MSKISSRKKRKLESFSPFNYRETKDSIVRCPDCNVIWIPNREYTDLCICCIKSMKLNFQDRLQKIRNLQIKNESRPKLSSFYLTEENSSGSSSSLDKLSLFYKNPSGNFLLSFQNQSAPQLLTPSQITHSAHSTSTEINPPQTQSPSSSLNLQTSPPRGLSVGTESSKQEDITSSPPIAIKTLSESKKRTREKSEDEDSININPVSNPVVSELLDKTDQLDLVTASSFWEACNNMDLDKMKEIMEKYPNSLVTYDEYGETVLHRTVYLPDIKVAKFLIEQGANVHIFNALTGASPLHRAVVSKKMDVVTLFLDNGASPNSRDFNGQTPLHCAVLSDYYDIARFLLERGAIVSALAFEKTSLEMAISTEMKDILNYYLAKQEKKK